MKESKVLFDPKTDSAPMTLLGVFPAHFIGLERGNAVNGNVPFNFLFRIAPEAKELKGINWKDNVEVEASSMPGREVRSIGVWFCPVVKPGEGWRNRRYVEMVESSGSTFPVDNEGRKQIGEIEVDDVIGKPCMVDIRVEYNKADLDKPESQRRKYPKVFATLPWENGVELPVDSILPNPFSNDDKPLF